MSRDLDSIIDEALSVKEKKINITYKALMEMVKAAFLEEGDNWENKFKKIYDTAVEKGSWTKMQAKHFPKKNNEAYNGSGGPSPWVTFDVFYPILKETYLYDVSKERLVDVGEGDWAKFLPPYKIWKGAELDERLEWPTGFKTDSNLALVKLRGGAKGYIPFAYVAKPGGGASKRVGDGSKSQDAVMDAIAARAAQEGVTATKISSAPPGSTKPDLVVDYGGTKIQFEIKGQARPGAEISFFDKSARRGRDNLILDVGVEAFVRAISVDYFPQGVGTEEKTSDNLGSAMKKTGFSTSVSGLFERTIGFFKKHVNEKIGFCGDPAPTSNSGTMPSHFSSVDPSVLSMIRSNVLEHLGKGGDNYFAVHSKSNNDAEIYYTGYGENTLGAKEFPELISGRLATYGGCSSGATRVAFKAKLQPKDDGLPEPEEV